MAALRIEEPRAAFEPNEASADDKDLTLSFQRGDSEAYRHIYDHYASTVRGVCWRMLRDKDDAQEATQETFLRVYQALGRFNGRYQLGPWITRIATNVCLDQLRGRNCRPQAATSIDDMATELPGDQLTPEEAYLSKLESSRVREVLDTMPSTHRAAIILREFEGLSYREISLALGVSETQVKALIHRARKRFKSSWAGRVSVLWPSALLHRLRGRAAPVGGSATDFVSSAASPITLAAPTTSGVFQQITTAVAERLAPALTAAVVGTTAVAGVPAVMGPAPQVAAVRTVAADKAARGPQPSETSVTPDPGDLSEVAEAGQELAGDDEGSGPTAGTGAQAPASSDELDSGEIAVVTEDPATETNAVSVTTETGDPSESPPAEPAAVPEEGAGDEGAAPPDSIPTDPTPQQTGDATDEETPADEGGGDVSGDGTTGDGTGGGATDTDTGGGATDTDTDGSATDTDTGGGATDTDTDGSATDTDTGDEPTDTGDGATDTGDGATDTGDGATDTDTDGSAIEAGEEATGTDTGDEPTDTGDGATDTADGATGTDGATDTDG